MKLRILNLALALAAATAFMSASAFAAGDAAKGKKVFNKCRACHTLEAGKDRIGPSLHGIIGRPAGSVESFQSKYSDAMKNSGVTWTEENLDHYLTKPKDFIPGNKMQFVGLRKEDDRQDVIAYLKENAM